MPTPQHCNALDVFANLKVWRKPQEATNCDVSSVAEVERCPGSAGDLHLTRAQSCPKVEGSSLYSTKRGNLLKILIEPTSTYLESRPGPGPGLGFLSVRCHLHPTSHLDLGLWSSYLHHKVLYTSPHRPHSDPSHPIQSQPPTSSKTAFLKHPTLVLGHSQFNLGTGPLIIAAIPPPL